MAPLDPDAKTTTLHHDRQEPLPDNHEISSSGTGRRASATFEAAKAGLVQEQPLKGIDNLLPGSNQVKAIAPAAKVVKWMEDVCPEMLSIAPLLRDMCMYVCVEATKAGLVQEQPLKGMDNPLPKSNQVKAIA